MCLIIHLPRWHSLVILSIILIYWDENAISNRQTVVTLQKSYSLWNSNANTMNSFVLINQNHHDQADGSCINGCPAWIIKINIDVVWMIMMAIPQYLCLEILWCLIFVYIIFMSQIGLYFPRNTSVVSFHMDVVLTLSTSSNIYFHCRWIFV